MIKDAILKGDLVDFCNQFNFTELKEDDAFEHFVNYILLSRINSTIFEDNDYIEKMNVDKGQNFGIDGVALLMNNTFVFDKDNISDFTKSCEHYPNINLNFIFTQAKTTAGFDMGDILKFTTAVRDFFKEQSYSCSKDLKAFWELKNELLDYSTLKYINRDSSPTLNLYYVTTGNAPTDDLILNFVKNQEKDILSENEIFKGVRIHLIDKSHLIKYYQEIQNLVEQRVIYKEKVDLGNMNGVGKAFLGHISINEYLKLIVDNEDNFRQNLFYENVRDFKGEKNKVNQEIAETIRTESLNDKFVLMNNGITVVAKHVDTNYQGGEVKIVNYQIVNGCQTSNVIYLNRKYIKENSTILIPLKLIECQDNDITNAITKATNNQNPVPEDAFIALEEFPKKLQKFFDSKPHSSPTKIYYERRSREYDLIIPKINQSQIFHSHKLIRAIVSMFLDQPHSCHRYPGELYQQTKSKIFGSEQKMFTQKQSPYPYYVSCYTWYILEQMFIHKELPAHLKQFKFFLLLMIRIKIAPEQISNFENIRDIEKYCMKLFDVIYDEKKYKPIVKSLCGMLDDILKKEKKSHDILIRTSIFTDEIKTQLNITSKKLKKNI